GSPAIKSGLKPGDRVISIGKEKVKDWSDAMKIIYQHPEEQAFFTIKRQNTTMVIGVDIGYQRGLSLGKHGFLGITSQFEWPKELIRKNQYTVWEAASHAARNTSDFLHLNFLLLGKILTGKVSLQSLGGPITIFESAGTALNNGIMPFLSYLAFLS